MTSPSNPAPILRLPLRGAVEDTSGRGNVAVSSNLTMIPDPDFGTCASFATPAKITLDQLACPLDFTVAAWVKRRADLPRYTTPTLFEFGNTWVILKAGKPQLLAQLRGETSQSQIVLRGTEVPLAWTHIAITSDASGGAIYIDGTLVGQCEPIAGPGTGLTIARSRTGQYFKGELAEFHVFDQALPLDAIRQLRTDTHPTLAAEQAAAQAAAAKQAAAEQAAAEQAAAEQATAAAAKAAAEQAAAEQAAAAEKAAAEAEAQAAAEKAAVEVLAARFAAEQNAAEKAVATKAAAQKAAAALWDSKLAAKKAATAAKSVTERPPLPAPVLRLPLRGSFLDASGGGNDPVVTAVTMPADPTFDACGSFDGKTSKLALANMKCPTNFTLSAWVRRSEQASNVALLTFGGSRLVLGLASGAPCIMGPKRGEKSTAWVKAGAAIATEWTHIAVTGNAGVTRLYVNGDPIGFGYPLDPGGDGLTIGQGSNSSFSNLFKGDLVEVQVFDQALSIENIKLLRTATHPKLAADAATADKAILDQAALAQQAALDQQVAAQAAAQAASQAAAAAAAAANGTVVHNLVLPGFHPHEKASAAKLFYQTHGDDYDFLIFVSPQLSPPQKPVDPHYFPIRRELCDGLGFTRGCEIAPVANGEAFGSPARLKGTIWLPLLDDMYGPPTINHELLHHWGTHLKSNWPGFITEGGHWGFASTNGSHGGFDVTSLRDANKQPVADPLSVKPGSTIRLSEFSAEASTICKAFSPIELYMMGLIDRTKVPQDIYVMKNPVFNKTEAADRTGVDPDTFVPDTKIYTVDGFTRIALDDLIALNAGGPPVATQTAFRAAFVLVTDAPATTAEMLKAAWYAKTAGRLVEDELAPHDQRKADYIEQQKAADDWSEHWAPTPQATVPRETYLSFAEATGDRATLDVHLTPRPAAP